MALPPFELIKSPGDWANCLARLRAEPRLAVDLEANSMFAYQERVCLMQISIPGQDYIVDPLVRLNMDGFGEIIGDPRIEKVFHAAEYDLILMKQQYGWQLHHLFDTMWAARILGYKKYGLANILGSMYGVRLNKRYQKSNWCKRPLTQPQLIYAQYDTHFLLQLRDDLDAQLAAAGRQAEAAETFAQQTMVALPSHEFDPDSFWSYNGVNDLTPSQQAVLRALVIYRDDEARRRDQPHFKVLSERTLMELAERSPRTEDELSTVYGMTNGQIARYGRQLLQIVDEARRSAPPTPPRRRKRIPDEVLNRYDRLHTWRKRRAQARGVESDVIVSREALWEIAKLNPQTAAELQQVEALGDWRRQTYGQEILRVIQI